MHRAVAVHHALGQPGGARGVHDEQQVVVGAGEARLVGRHRAHPGLVVLREGRHRAAHLHPGAQVGLVAAALQLGHHRREVLGIQQHGGAGILEDELQLVGHQPPVQRHVDRADLGHREEGLDELGAVHQQQRHAVARASRPHRAAHAPRGCSAR